MDNEKVSMSHYQVGHDHTLESATPFPLNYCFWKKKLVPYSQLKLDKVID